MNRSNQRVSIHTVLLWIVIIISSVITFRNSANNLSFNIQQNLSCNNISSSAETRMNKKPQQQQQKLYFDSIPSSSTMAAITLLLLLLGLLIISSTSTASAADVSVEVKGDDPKKSCTKDEQCAYLLSHYFCNNGLCNCKLFYTLKMTDLMTGCTAIKCAKDEDCAEGQDVVHKSNVMCKASTGQCACAKDYDLSASNGTACLPPAWAMATFLWVVLGFCVLGCVIGCAALIFFCQCGGGGGRKKKASGSEASSISKGGGGKA